MARGHVARFLILVVFSSAFPITVSAETDSDHGQYPFRFTRVTRTEDRTAHLFRVEYEAEATPTVFLTIDGISTEVEQSHLRLGVVEVRIPKVKTGSWDYDKLSFLCRQVGLVHLYLDLTSSSTAMDIPRIHARIQQGSDVTFPPGGDFHFDVTYRPEGNATFYAVHTRALVKSEDEENVVQRFNPRDDKQAPLKLVLASFAGDIANFNVTFRGSPSGGRRDVEGILEVEFKTALHCSSSCLVPLVTMPFQISFYREDHAGPFPSGFVGFVRDVGARAHQSRFYCGFGSQEDWPCYVGCEVAGDHPMAVRLSRLGSNPDEDEATNPTRAADVFALAGDHEATAYTLVHSSSGDGDFRCTARSSTREVTETISVHFVAYPKIDRELSSITKYENGSLKATCVATGRPAPSISFFQSNSGYPQTVNPDDYDVTEVRVDDSTTRAELFLRRTSYRVAHVDCSAANNPDRGDFYRMYVDDYSP